jgi:hypothetical protein
MGHWTGDHISHSVAQVFLVKWLLDRENEQLSKYGDTKSARNIMLLELKKLIEANPLFRDKLAFPSLKASRLRTLINQRFVTCPFNSVICALDQFHGLPLL